MRPKLEIVGVKSPQGERRGRNNATAAGASGGGRSTEFETDDEVTFKCVSPNGRPAATLAWYLNDEPVNGGYVNAPETIATPLKANQTLQLFTAVQTFVLNVRSTDDQKMLQCRATQLGQTQTAQLLLQVGCECA